MGLHESYRKKHLFFKRNQNNLNVSIFKYWFNECKWRKNHISNIDIIPKKLFNNLIVFKQKDDNNTTE